MDRRTNEWVLKEIDEIQKLLESLNARKLKFLGHVANTEGISKGILFGTVPGKRGRGRPKTRLSDNVKDVARISMPTLHRLAPDRSGWQEFVKNVPQQARNDQPG